MDQDSLLLPRWAATGPPAPRRRGRAGARRSPSQSPTAARCSRGVACECGQGCPDTTESRAAAAVRQAPVCLGCPLPSSLRGPTVYRCSTWQHPPQRPQAQFPQSAAAGAGSKSQVLTRRSMLWIQQKSQRQQRTGAQEQACVSVPRSPPHLVPGQADKRGGANKRGHKHRMLLRLGAPSTWVFRQAPQALVQKAGSATCQGIR